MVNIDQNGIKASFWLCGVKADTLSGTGKEITTHELASWISTQIFAKWQKARLMPFDDRLQSLDNMQTANATVTKHRFGRVAKPQAADHDIQLASIATLFTVIGKAQRCKGDFRCGEEVRHQMLIAKHNLKNIGS